MAQFEKSNKSVMIFGCDFVPERRTSEINFWNDVVPLFAAHFKEVVVLSVNNRKNPQEKIFENIWLYNVKPYYIGNTGGWKNPEFTGYSFHKRPFSIFYKTYSFLRYIKTFDRIIEKHHIGVVHYMRNFGLLNEILTRKYPEIFFTITVPTHIDRGGRFNSIYHMFKNMTLKPMDKIIPTSKATGNRLIKLGIPRNRIEIIHWASNQEAMKVSNRSPAELRNHYGISVDNLAILWSGPLQDAGSTEFFYSLAIAEKVIWKSKKFTFVFAFKPDTIDAKYLDSVADSKRIKVIETDENDFANLINISDIFLSPVCNKNRTIAPPLTWIEVMQIGIPIITTEVEGVDEIIVHKENGFIVDGIEETSDIIRSLSNRDIEKMKESCKEMINREYNIDYIAREYIELWDNQSQ